MPVRMDWLVGKTCTSIYRHYPNNCSFEFGSGVLHVECLWRIVAGGRLVLTSQDHEQQFGLPNPRDVYAVAESLLKGRCALALRVREETADLRVDFDGNFLLEVLADSSGYEPWQFTAPGVHLVALGGGGIADFSTVPPH